MTESSTVDTVSTKGTTLIAQVDFVKQNFGQEGYNRWLAALSPEARALMEGPIFASSWYAGPHAVIESREKLCAVFWEGDARRARELGRFSAQRGLSGIYKAFVRFGAPEWVASRSAQAFSHFFKPAEISTIIKEKCRLLLRLSLFSAKSEALEESVCGFIQLALELSGAQAVQVERIKSLARGDEQTDFEASWTMEK